MDETQIHYYQQKRNEKVKTVGQSTPAQKKITPSAGKVMAIVF